MTEQELRRVVLDVLEAQLRAKGLNLPAIDDSTRLADVGIVDSMGFLTLVSEVERRTSKEPDFSDADPEDFASFGGLIKVLMA